MYVCATVLLCVLQFLRFIEQLSGILGVDCISADVGLDGATDAVLMRAEQLAKNEAAAATEQKSQIYALKRKLKTMKEQLDGKVRMSLLKYLAASWLKTFDCGILFSIAFLATLLH